MRRTDSHVKSLTRVGLWGLLACWSLVGAGSAPLPPAGNPTPEFQFVRLAYSSGVDSGRGRYGRGGGSWLTDAPAAEEHFLQGVKRLTRLSASSDSVGIRPTDPQILNYPFLYAKTPRGCAITCSAAAF